MKKIYKREFIRNDNRKLLLFGYNKHTESSGNQLEAIDIPKPHMRWNPSRQEWVTYNAERKNITIGFVFSDQIFTDKNNE